MVKVNRFSSFYKAKKKLTTFQVEFILLHGKAHNSESRLYMA